MVFCPDAGRFQIQRTYQRASEPKAKRDVEIKAIDDGVIKCGLSLVDAKVMFGDDLQTFRRDTNSALKAIVFSIQQNHHPIR